MVGCKSAGNESGSGVANMMDDRQRYFAAALAELETDVAGWRQRIEEILPLIEGLKARLQPVPKPKNKPKPVAKPAPDPAAAKRKKARLAMRRRRAAIRAAAAATPADEPVP
jgi:hypothetical protein